MSKSATDRIQWLEWGPEAFEKAKSDNKPLLLSIGAVWCHWCHVQDRKTYSDPDIVELVNRYYVPIRVDNDKRPDINARYNMGGWPTTVFLNSEGNIITGATYVPPEHMKKILRNVKKYYDTAHKIPIAPTVEEKSSRTSEISQEIVDDILGSVVASFDSVYGGFGDAPKFPQTDSLELALSQHWCTGDNGLLTIVTKTLDRMGDGGIYDSEEGGFFRYSTTRDWTLPHFEKMCENNAKLLSTYLHAYQATGRDRYRKLVEEITGYVNSTLSDQNAGGFYGSQDSDEDYYRLSRNERTKRERPSVDQTLYTNLNGLMAAAYLEAAPVLRDNALAEFSLKTIDRLLRQLRREEDGIMYHFLSDGTPQVHGLLADQVTFAEALLRAHQTTAAGKYLEHSEALVCNLDEQLLDTRNGGYYDSVQDGDSIGRLKEPVKALEENSYTAILLMRLHHVTGKEAYLQKAKTTLEALAGEYETHGIMASVYALAVDLYLNEPTRIVVVGPKAERLTNELLEASLRAYAPRKVVIPLDPETDSERIIRLGFPSEEEPRAYACVGKTCLAPMTLPSEIGPQMSKAVRQQASNSFQDRSN